MPDLMPAAASTIRSAVARLLTVHGPLPEDELLDLLRAEALDLGPDPLDTLDEALESEDGPLVLPLADGRQVLLPALLVGRIFTHRLTETEVRHDLLEVTPDLQPVSMLTERATHRQLVDGAPLSEVLRDFDAAELAERGAPLDDLPEVVLLLPPGRLVDLGVGAGDLVGLRVRPDGFELVAVTDGGLDTTAASGLGALFTAVVESTREGGPSELDIAVWTACAQDDSAFRTPVPPLGEVLDEAGLAVSGEQVAPGGFDFARWRVERRIASLQNRHDLTEDEALATVVISTLYERVRDLFGAAVAAQETGDLSDVVDLADRMGAGPEAVPDGAPIGRASGALGDRQVVRDTLPFLAEPAVAQAVLVETIGADRGGAAALGLFAETVEAQAPRGARPALRWLRAKALERLGNVADAEAALDAAESMDPSWSPLLFDLARYASDRGDAERGLDLLRRAGAPSNDDLVVLLERMRAEARPGLGRNQPCWCGSGRKYKQCHLRREQQPLEERALWLYRKAETYLTDGPWREALLDLAAQRSAHWDSPGAVYLALRDPLVVDSLLFEGGAFEEFLDQRGFLLPDDERLLAQQWLLVERSVYEVESVRPGRGLSVRDVRTGDRHEVRERSASTQLRTGELICTRIVPAGQSLQVFGGIEPVGLHERDQLVELLDSEPEPFELVGALSRRFAPPVLQNTEGDPLVLCEARLHVDDSAALARALDREYEVVDAESPTRAWHELVTTDGMLRIRATLRLERDRLSVETNSEARMDRVLAKLRDLQPGVAVLEQVRRPAGELREAMRRAPGGAPPPQVLDPSEPEVAAALEQAVLAYEESWLDQSIPALAGHTPREAADDPTRRPDLVRLLDSFPPATGPGQMSPERLRRSLGLT